MREQPTRNRHTSCAPDPLPPARAWRRYAAEVGRLKSTFRGQAQVDVDAMREAVDKYRGLWEERAAHLERLGMQKKLLVQQVGANALRQTTRNDKGHLHQLTCDTATGRAAVVSAAQLADGVAAGAGGHHAALV